MKYSFKHYVSRSWLVNQILLIVSIKERAGFMVSISFMFYRVPANWQTKNSSARHQLMTQQVTFVCANGGLHLQALHLDDHATTHSGKLMNKEYMASGFMFVLRKTFCTGYMGFVIKSNYKF
jgi:anaerobic C4-dicarboxylate transporter